MSAIFHFELPESLSTTTIHPHTYHPQVTTNPTEQLVKPDSKNALPTPTPHLPTSPKSSVPATTDTLRPSSYSPSEEAICSDSDSEEEDTTTTTATLDPALDFSKREVTPPRCLESTLSKALSSFIPLQLRSRPEPTGTPETLGLPKWLREPVQKVTMEVSGPSSEAGWVEDRALENSRSASESLLLDRRGSVWGNWYAKYPTVESLPWVKVQRE